MADDTPKPTLPFISSETSPDEEQPEIYGLSNEKNGIVLKRRSFLGALAATGALASTGALPGCIPLPGLNSSASMGPVEAASKAQAHETPIWGLEFRNDSLFSWSANEIKFWDVSKGAKIDTAPRLDFVKNGKKNFPNLFRHAWDNMARDFRQDGEMLAVGGKDGVVLWRSGQEEAVQVKTLRGGPKELSALALDPDGIFAAAGAQGTIVVWNLKTNARYSIPHVKASPNALCFHPHEPVLFSAEDDGTIREWSIPGGKAGKVLRCHDKPIQVFRLAVTPDGKHAITQSIDDTIKIWSLPDGTEKGLLSIPKKDTVSAMNIDRNGRILAAGTIEGRIYLWRLPDGELIGNLFDPTLLQAGTPMSQYRQMGPQIQTQPCGKPLPQNSSCICDCVSASRTYPTAHQVCTCDTIAVPVGYSGGGTCVCNTISVGSKVAPTCSCVGHVSRGGGGGGSHYWRPN